MVTFLVHVYRQFVPSASVLFTAPAQQAWGPSDDMQASTAAAKATQGFITLHRYFRHKSGRDQTPAEQVIYRDLHPGIVQGKGHVKDVHKQHEFSSIHIQFPTGKTDAIQTGASVAINGTCLTVSVPACHVQLHA